MKYGLFHLVNSVSDNIVRSIYFQYPKYLEENKDKISAKDFENYTTQYEIIQKICTEFESESDSDSSSVKDKRLEKIMDFMEKMRSYGQPPKELIGEMVSS